MFGAPEGTRTPNNGSEDHCDIHFTTGARQNYASTLFWASPKATA